MLIIIGFVVALLVGVFIDEWTDNKYRDIL